MRHANNATIERSRSEPNKEWDSLQSETRPDQRTLALAENGHPSMLNDAENGKNVQGHA